MSREGFFTIISIGNELLTGRTLNTNSQWLCKRITDLGGSVHRIVCIGDHVQTIVETLREEMDRAPSVMVTTGGLGPTFDDMTLEAVARTLGVELQLHPDAEGMVRGRYQMIFEGKEFKMTAERLKMATIPKGARPLENPVGTAPGVLIETGAVAIVCLPGVPNEMMAIFERAVEPFIKSRVGVLRFAELNLEVFDVMESSLAPVIKETVSKIPQVYVKSHPRGSEQGQSRIVLNLSCRSAEGDEAKTLLHKSAAYLTDRITALGGRTNVAQ